MNKIEGSQVKKSLLLTFVWLGIFWFIGARPTWSFRPDLHDHISNLHATVLFWEKGFSIFENPISELVAVDKSARASQVADQWKWPKEELFVLPGRSNENPLMLVWGHMPRPYPPGLFLLLSPLALLMESCGGFSELILIFMTLTFCLVGHFAFFQFKKVFDTYNYKNLPKPLYWILLFSLYLEIVGWSLSGQYEALGLLFLVNCFGTLVEKRYLCALCYFCFGVFFHFRLILWCLPFLVVWLINAKKMYLEFLAMSPFKKLVPLVAVACGVISGIVFLKVTKDLLSATTGANQFSIKFLTLDFTANHYVFVIGLIGGFSYFIWKKNWLMILAMCNVAVLFLKANFLQPWYVLFFFPFLIAFNSNYATKLEAFIRYGLIVLFGFSFLNSSPIEFYFLKRFILMATGHG